MAHIAHTLQPTKFLLLVLQIVAISSAMKLKNQHIYAAISPSLGADSDQYLTASASYLFWCWLSLILLVAEFLIIFGGKTLFNSKYNLMMIGMHLIGLTSTLLFLGSESHYSQIQVVWALAALCPFGIEVLSFVYSKTNYRKAFIV